jgi:hypothetical protein
MHASSGDIDACRSFPVKIVALAIRALERAAPGMVDIGRDDFWPDLSVLRSAAYWAAASWEVHVACASAVPGGSRANLYFHGWLHEASRLRGEGSGILQPLVGVFGAQGSIRHDEGDGDMLAAGTRQHSALRQLHADSFSGPSVPFDELSGHEMHYHGDSQLEVRPPTAALVTTPFSTCP